MSLRRREFIAGLGSAATWPLAARAQQPVMPVIAVIHGGTRAALLRQLTSFQAALAETGHVAGQNISIEYHFLEGHFDRIPALIAELVRRRVAVIATPASVAAALAAKAATTTIPIVFGVNDNPVRLGLVASLARPGSNLTGMNFFSQEAVTKRIGLLHDLVPKARRMALLVNPSNSAASETMLRDAPDAARAMGVSIDIVKAVNSAEIDAAFETMARERVEALHIAGDSYFQSRLLQLATLATRHGVAASYSGREFTEVGGLMSYAVDTADMFHQVGSYTGQILKGAKPADLPVVQSTRFEFVINLQTARALGIDIPPGILAIADQIID
jgi:putative ABC transport system substrate-binding protein